MKERGFTLVEVLLALFLLGLISVTVLPIVTSSLMNMGKSKVKMEMNYIGEMAIERIKSYNEDSSTELEIFGKKLSEIIECFRKPGTGEIHISGELDNGKYLLKIIKEQRNDILWKISIYVYHDEEGSKLKHVEYKTYFLKK